MSSRVQSTVIENLRSILQGQVVSPQDPTYDTARQLWNGAVDHYPALVVFCETVRDVQAALCGAVDHGLPISVRGGGYDWAGRSIRTHGLVIDLSTMKHVSVDAQARIATIQGGATAGNVIAAAAPHGLAAVVGTMSNIGMAGMTLAGGYGPLTTRFGLALDNLLAIELVLADGTHLRASSSENPDLFWALRGGGGNFGVVTSMDIRLHPVEKVLTGKILFPWSDARSVLSGYAQIMSSAPDELSVTVGVGSAPDGSSAVFMAPFWSGDLARGEQIIATLQKLGTPLMAGVRPTNYEQVFGLFEGSAPARRQYMQQTRWLSAITPEVITCLIDSIEGNTSPFSLVAVQSFHGAPSRIPLPDTAFGLRQKHFMSGIVAAWDPTDRNNAHTHQRWSRGVSQQLAPYSLPGGYPNLLGPDEHVQIDAAYGSNITRLREIKCRFDPQNLFIATPLPV